ncbi:uncharacterized protein LOC125023531 [Mugil cephalus]|uniref:uncharacterized protein LOC125023531 n=1 Tax=Mugil cephalus TaxID=48193 RepID=UPI001FB5F749|nr:uncharacterized protein LOC125023531 [Mugil cephalus]
MGSMESRPRPCKVAPCDSLQEQGQKPEPEWTIPALPLSVEQTPGSLGQRKTTLPPLKQEITLSSLSGSSPLKQSNNSSIIHSHPPRRPQALQPISHTTAANLMPMGRARRDGGVHRSFTAGQTGTGRMVQGGFLEAQIAATQQTHQHRQAQLRRATERRRQKVVYTANEGIQQLKLVRRTTERDIFWDETTGSRLEPSCLLESKYLPNFSEEGPFNQQRLLRKLDLINKDQAHSQEEGAVEQARHKGLFLDIVNK